MALCIVVRLAVLFSIAFAPELAKAAVDMAATATKLINNFFIALIFLLNNCIQQVHALIMSIKVDAYILKGLSIYDLQTIIYNS